MDKNLYQQDASAKTYTGIYAMHKYWSKKPFNLVANYIERYSQNGDIVLDPFCGSGVVAIEAVRSNRRAVAIDINPIAVFSTKMGLQHINMVKLKKTFNDLRRQLMSDLDKLYLTTCPICQYWDAVATHTIWENGQQSEIWVACPNCKTSKVIKTPSPQDIQFVANLPEPTEWYPTLRLIENPRINAKAGMRVSDLFTNRALIALSKLLKSIHHIDDNSIRDVLLFCFSAALSQASKMVFVIRRRGKNTGKRDKKGRAEVGSWVIGYWVPSEHFEIHVWRCFENRFRRIVKGKQAVNDLIPSNVLSHSSFEELLVTNQGYLINVGNATDLTLPDESIDYIFTDPPHGNRIPYLELSLMWNSWLKYESDWENEIVISEAKTRTKRVEDYHLRLEQAFAEFWRVLKPNKYISIAFNSLDDETWISLLDSCLGAGFELVEVRPLEYSARSVVQDNRKNALKTDFVITCSKGTAKTQGQIRINNSKFQIEYLIRDYVSQHTHVQTYDIINQLLIASTAKGELFKISTILSVLESRFSFEKGYWHN